MICCVSLEHAGVSDMVEDLSGSASSADYQYIVINNNSAARERSTTWKYKIYTFPDKCPLF